MNIFLINAGCLALVGSLAVLADMIYSDVEKRRRARSRSETAPAEPGRTVGASPH
jgi:hypothetical protein